MAVLSESQPRSPRTAAVFSQWHDDHHDIEAAWIEAARHDLHAFAPLYDRYSVPVYRSCYRKVRHGEGLGYIFFVPGTGS